MLTIRNAYLSYPDRKIVLKNLNLNIKTGECVVLTGISGSGKSSILNLINGLAISSCQSINQIQNTRFT